MAYNIDNEYYRKQINQDGVVPLERNNRDRWNSAALYIQAGLDYLNIPSYRTLNPGFIQDSQYNNLVGNISLLTPEDYYNSLQLQQSTWAALGNALVNNVVIAGTTFAQNMIGIPSGIFNAINDNSFSSQFVNPLSKTLVDWQKQVQELLPIYRGSDYENKNLWEKMGNGVFWADLLQNFGFTEGSAAAMAVCKYLGMPMMLSAFAGSIGEATVQAVNKYNENIKYKQDLLDQQLVNDMAKAASEQERQNLIDNRLHNDALIDDDERRAGNVNYIENIGLLTLTNAIEFGQWLQQDYSLARIALKGRANPIVENGFVTGIENLSKGEEMLRAVGMKTLQASTEGIEEFAQDIFDKQTLFRNSEKFNNVLFDDEYRDKATSMLDTFVKGLTSTLNDKQTAVDVMSGFITGFIGTPTLSKHVFENGIISGIRNTSRAVENTNAIIDEINKRLEKDPISKSTYDNLVRQLMSQDELNIALENDDLKSFKDALTFSYISDLINYDDIGLLYLKEQELESYRNMSDELLEELIKPINDPKTGLPFTVEEARENLNKRIDFMKKHLDFFKNNKKAFLSKYPNVSNETLHQAMFLMTQVDSWRNRMNDSGDAAYDQYVKLWNKIVESEKDEVINGVSVKHNGRYRRKKVNDQRILKPYNRNRSLNDNEVVVLKLNNNTYTIIENPENLSENDKVYIARKSDLKRVFESKEEESFFDKLKKMLNVRSDVPDTDIQYTLETSPFSKNEFLKLLSVFPDFAKNQIELMNEQRYGFTEDEKRNFELSITEYPLLVESINKYLNDYLEMISNINKYDIEQKQKAQKVRKIKSTKQKKNFKDSLKNISTVKDFEKELRNSNLTEDEKELMVNELVGENHLAAKEYRSMKQYFDKFVEEILTTPDEEEDGSGEMRLTALTKKDVLDLFKDNYEHSNTFAELSNPESLRINYTLLFPKTPEGIIRKTRAQYFTKAAIKLINETDDRFSSLVNPTLKDEGVKQEVKKPQQVALVLNDTEIKVDNFTKPEPKEIVFDDTSKQYEDNSSYQPTEPKDNEQKEYMRPALPQLVWLEVGLNSILVTFDDYKKRTNGGDYSEIVRYLTSAGAYKYVNKGKLQVGHEIEFVVDPKIKYQGQPLIILRSNGQIIGSLNIGNASLYKGLLKLISDIYEAYNNLENKDDNTEYVYQKDGKPFVTHVALIMNGNIMIARDLNGNNIENDIYDIVDKDAEGKITDMPILGIMTLNGIETNGKIDPGKIIQPNSLLLQLGRAFILSPNATGQYMAIPVYTKRLSESEFNLNDPRFRDTIIGKQVSGAITKLGTMSVESWDDFEKAIHELANILYLGDVHINTYIRNDNDELVLVDRNTKFKDGDFHIDALRIFKFKTNPNGTYETDESGKRIEENMSVVDLDDDSIQYVDDSLIEAFMKLNVPILVNKNTINTIAGEYDYNQGLISSHVLTSNISSVDILNAWFTMDYFDETSGTFVSANSPKAKTLSKVMSDYTKGGDSNTVGGVSLDNTFPVEIKGLNGGIYNFDPKEKKVYKDGKDVTSKLNEDFINRIKYIYIVKNNMTQVHSYKGVYIINFGTDNEIYFDYPGLKVITEESIKQGVKKQVLENLKSTKKYSDFLQQVEDYSKRIVTSDTDTPKTHNISNEDASETIQYTDVSNVYDPNDISRLPGNMYHFLISSKLGSKKSSYKSLFIATFNDLTMSGELKVNEINRKINLILSLFVYSTRLSSLFPVNSPQRRQLYLNKSSEFTEEWINWFFSKSPLIEEIKRVPRIYNDRYSIEQNFKQFVSDVLGGKLSEYIQSTGAYIEKNADITLEQNKSREKLAEQYKMNPNNFVVLLRRMNQFIKDCESQGCKVIATNLKVYHTYEDQNVAGNIDLLLSDNNGNLYIYDFFATTKYWDTKNPSEKDAETQLLYSDATIETDKLILLKNMFELQYGIKINDVGAVPFTYNNNDKGILDETPSIKRYLTDDAKYEQPLSYIEVSSRLNSSESYLTFDKLTNQRIIREAAKLDAYTLNSDDSVTWRLHTSILIPDTSNSVLSGIAYNVDYSSKQAEEPVVVEEKLEKLIEPEKKDEVKPEQTLDDNQKKVLDIFNKHGELSISDAREYLKWGFNKTSDTIKSLVELGKLTKTSKYGYSSTEAKPVLAKPLEEKPVTIMEKKPNNPKDSLVPPLTLSLDVEKQMLADIFGEDAVDGFDRLVDNTIEYKPLNLEKELKWLRRVLPLINQDAAIRIFDKIINSKGQEAWGHFSDSIILLEEGAAEGTVYHEAFHFVFLTIFSDSERTLLKNEAMYQFGSKTYESAEEDLANAFMEYTMDRNSRGLLPRIKQFFDYLIDLIRVAFMMLPHIQYYFYKINSAKYANNETINVNESQMTFRDVTTVNTMNEFRKIPPAQRKQMVEKGWTQEVYDSLSNEEKQLILHCLHV